ncbi:acyltransferase family protein [Bradyrhizobium monzae]|uniref:acyltransferase family protein n=1 Tax=Bradyrhizobium sp. Oc8 TaxID=2876780 RepID=UPI001F162B6E|nr:acyltransferase [Bradyrhizobium sp. Oc8]
MSKNHSPAAVRPGKNLEIEYLRAIAVIMVVLVHSPVLFPGMDLGQWTGVDLFFCISGYVISRGFEQSFDEAIADGRWGSVAPAFWVRRVFRLAPSAWLWLAVSVFGSWAYNSTGVFPGTPEQNLWDGLFVLGLFANFAYGLHLMHSNRFFWSLALEDQFYILFPLFILWVRPYWRWVVLGLLILLQAIPDRSFHGESDPKFLWAMRLDALMWGYLIYLFSRSKFYALAERLIVIFLRYRLLAFAVSAVLIFLLIDIPKERFARFIGGQIESQVALVSAGLVFLASYDRGYALPLPGFLKTIFAWIGARSYAIYLIHIPLFWYLMETWSRISHLLGAHAPDKRYFYAVAFPVALCVLADLNFRLVETPLRRKGVALANRILALPAPSGTGVLATSS